MTGCRVSSLNAAGPGCGLLQAHLRGGGSRPFFFSSPPTFGLTEAPPACLLISVRSLHLLRASQRLSVLISHSFKHPLVGTKVGQAEWQARDTQIIDINGSFDPRKNVCVRTHSNR